MTNNKIENAVVIVHRERLSERTPRTGDAIVCSASNKKMQKLAEMTSFNGKTIDNKQDIHEVLAHYLPWVSAVRTGIGPFVAPCWIAAVVYDEDFKSGLTVNEVRNWLLSWEQRSGIGKIVVGAYRLHGEAVAEVVKKSSLLKKGFKTLFDVVLKKARN